MTRRKKKIRQLTNEPGWLRWAVCSLVVGVGGRGIRIRSVIGWRARLSVPRGWCGSRRDTKYLPPDWDGELKRY